MQWGGLDDSQGPCHTKGAFNNSLVPPWDAAAMSSLLPVWPARSFPGSILSRLSLVQLTIHLSDKNLRRARPPWGFFLFCKHVCLCHMAKETPCRPGPHRPDWSVAMCFHGIPHQSDTVGIFVTSCGGQGTMPCELGTLTTWKAASFTDCQGAQTSQCSFPVQAHGSF